MTHIHALKAQNDATEALALAREVSVELANTKLTLGTLISWLQAELGSHNVDTLLKNLHEKDRKEP